MSSQVDSAPSGGSSNPVSSVDLDAGVHITPGLLTWTQTIVPLNAATSTLLIAANSNRKALRWQNVGVNPMTVRPGTTAAVVSQGMNYNGAASAGQAGDAETFIDDLSQGAFTAISTLGTSVCVWEGH